jgi:hypothetical protein
VRGLALERGLARAGFAGRYRMFGPALPFPVAHSVDYTAVEIQGDLALRRAETARESELARALTAFAPDLVIVDLFWATIQRLLPALGCPAWLLVRSCPERWLVGPPALPFEAGLYERIFAIEPVEHTVVHEEIPPIVIANPDECQPPEALRARLGVPPGQPLFLALHAGERGELTELAREAALDLEARGAGTSTVFELDLFAAEALFPAACWLGGADHVWSGAGYNAFWEAHWLGYAERTTFLPFARSIDHQRARVERHRGRRPEANGADVLAARVLVGG